MGGIIYQFVVSYGVSPYGFNVLCLVSVRAMMFGFGCVLGRDCMYNFVVCIPLVSRVRDVMVGWV